MKTETIHWHELPADGLPDADMVVLAEVRDCDAPDTTEVWPAFWSGERWVDCGSGWPIDAGRVVAWADQPAGTVA
jgi:hypothetical protein